MLKNIIGVVALISLVACVWLLACQVLHADEIEKRRTVSAFERIVYVKDEQTGICFAAIGYGQNLAFTAVPEASVPKHLLRTVTHVLDRHQNSISP